MHNNVLNLINTVIGKRVNRGAGLGLEKPMDYTFYGDARVVLWLEKAFKKITENIDAKVAKCLLLEYLHCSKNTYNIMNFIGFYSSDNSGATEP